MQGRSGPAFFSSIPKVQCAWFSNCCGLLFVLCRGASFNEIDQCESVSSVSSAAGKFLVMFEDFAFFMTVGVKTSNENCSYAVRYIAAGSVDGPKLPKSPAAACPGVHLQSRS